MKAKIRIFLFVVAAMVAAFAVITLQRAKIRQLQEEAGRLASNQTALLTAVEYSKAENGRLMATVNALTLRRDELEELIPAYNKELKNARVRIRELESIASVSYGTAAEVEAVPDTTYVSGRGDVPAPVVQYRFEDDYLTAKVRLRDSSALLSIQSRDTLTIIAHRKRVRCLFRKKGRILYYTVVPASPYTQIEDVRYVEVVE